MDDALVNVLATCDKEVKILTSPDGSEILLLPYGGRILGLFSAGSRENFFWTNPLLKKPETAITFFSGKDWQNTGGDRTWLAPEIDFFFPKFPDRTEYVQPRQLDPGNYAVRGVENQIELINECSLVPSRSKKEIQIRISKKIEPAPNPIRYEPMLESLFAVEYAGYTLISTLELLAPNDEATIGLWNLLQMPHTGTMLIPTFSRTNPNIYFGDLSEDDLIVGEHMVCYRMRAAGEQKIGVRAVCATGRVGYMRSGDAWSLVVRKFTVNPSGEYVDVPWQNSDDLGYGVQACNVNSGLGSFSELEYHVPAIGGKTGHDRCTDTTQVWAFRGAGEKIIRLAQFLLGRLAL